MNKLVLGLSVLGLVACGDDGSNVLPDAPVAPDAAIDAAPDTPVTLTITLGGQPVADVDVYFVNPDGSLVAKVPTNASGVASAVVESGASVTARDPFVNRPTGKARTPHLRTFMGVKPGDQLRLDDGSSNTSIEFVVTLPTEISADRYEFHTSCGDDYASIGSQGSGSTPTGTVYLYDCASPIDLLAVAYDANNAVLGSFFKADVVVADQQPLDLTAETYQTAPDVTYTFTNVPAPFTSLDFRAMQVSSKGTVWSQHLTTDVTAGMAMQTVQRPAVSGAVTVTLATLGWFQPFRTAHQVVEWGAATPTLDVGAGVLQEFATDPTYAPATRTLSWMAGPGGLTPDFSVSRIDLTSATKADYYRWDVVAPYTGASITYPTLPAEAYPFVPSAQDSAFVLDLITTKVPGGYDAARAHVFSTDGPNVFGTNPTGRMAVAFWQQQGRPVRPPTQAISPWSTRAGARARR